MSRWENSGAREQLKINSNSKPGLDSFKVMSPVLEGIVEGIEGKNGEQAISEFYIGAFGIWGSMELWPRAIERFYGQLNYKLKNPDSMTCVESRDNMVIGAIKNKWLSTTGVSFKGRFERLKLLSEKNIRDDGSKIGTREVRVKRVDGTIKINFVRWLEKKDYKIKGIEEHGRARKYIIIQKGKDKGKRQFAGFVR